jgi:hypothetical protein
MTEIVEILNLVLPYYESGFEPVSIVVEKFAELIGIRCEEVIGNYDFFILEEEEDGQFARLVGSSTEAIKPLEFHRQTIDEEEEDFLQNLF